MSLQDAHPAAPAAPDAPLDQGEPVIPGTPESPGIPAPLETTDLRTRLGRYLDRIPFRHKLNVLVTVPVVVISILFAVVVNSEISTAQTAAAQADLVRNSYQVALLVDDVQSEQQQALLLWAHFDRQNAGDPAPSSATFRAAVADTTAQVALVRQAFGSGISAAESIALAELDALPRDQVVGGVLPAPNIDQAYSPAAAALIDGLGLTTDDSVNSPTTQTLDALLRADAAHAVYETSVLSTQTGDSNALVEFLAAVGAQEQYGYQVQRFAQLATPAQATELGGMDHNTNQVYIGQQLALLEVSPGDLSSVADKASMRAAAAQVDQTLPKIVGESQIRLAITQKLTQEIAAGADSASNSAWLKAILLLALALLIFVTWLTLSVLIRHSVVRPVQRLTNAARKVAAISEKELARVADDDAVDESPARLEAVPVLAQDELGALAEAFNQVQITAAGLLERQVTSRRNIAEMFGNIGRRVSNLTNRQLALIDAVERGETDPELLEQLYRIDHIAVRMQRNADSLMLLAGIRESELDGRPAPVSHVIRASLGQIEGYQRVVLRAESDPTVAPDIVGDLVLMLAELLENAVSFSPAHSSVEVTVRVSGGHAAIEIVDHGLGMGSERLAEENARLVRRERLDLVPTRVLGLFVVGNLARRWGITVTLSRTPGGGVSSLVLVPAALLRAASAAPAVSAPAVPTALTAPAAPAEPAAPVAPAPAAAPAAAAAATGWPSPGGPAPVPAAAAQPPDGGLPRRTPRRSTDEPVHTQASAVEPQTGETARPGTEGGTLRRRVRGATLNQGRPTQPAAAAFAPPQLDAEAVRDSLEEFEEAVSRAERDSTLTGLRISPQPGPQPQDPPQQGAPHQDSSHQDSSHQDSSHQDSSHQDSSHQDSSHQDAAPTDAAPQELPEGVGP
ncbi:signal transduction histidine kinase [Streptomyces sp. 846.5]|nr:ATP-binding protein [Streptomyces sp. 846.5]TDU04968.1 signal transduction histidine kinase [Streptomyces sp. 846.5]